GRHQRTPGSPACGLTSFFGSRKPCGAFSPGLRADLPNPLDHCASSKPFPHEHATISATSNHRKTGTRERRHGTRKEVARAVRGAGIDGVRLNGRGLCAPGAFYGGADQGRGNALAAIAAPHKEARDRPDGPLVRLQRWPCSIEV